MAIKYPEELNFLGNRNAEQKTTENRMDAKVCLVSGATSGVGLVTMKRLIANGARVIMLVRNPKKAEKVNAELKAEYNVEADVVLADFSDLHSVRKAALWILENYPVIDVFVNSVGLHSTKKVRTKCGLELVLCVNHLAPFLLVNLLKERFIECGTRIILVNSEGHRFNGLDIDDLNWNNRIYTGLRGYGASKTAQILSLQKYNLWFEYSDVKYIAVHPGDVKTNIGHNNGLLYRWFLHNITWNFLKDAEISGDALYYLCATDSSNINNGKYYNLTNEELPAKHARDSEMAEKIWQKTKIMCGLE